MCECEDGYMGDLCEEGMQCMLTYLTELTDLMNRCFGCCHCTIEINECDSDPCQNSGTCIDQLNGFVCRCEDGYDGDFCENSRTTVLTQSTSI